MSTEWITWSQAAELVGCSVSVIERHKRSGQIRSRPVRVGRHYRPTLDRASVEKFAAWWVPMNAERERRRAARVPRVPEPIGPPDDDQVWLSLSTVALMLGCSEQWVGRLASRERIPAARRGRRWWFRRLDVEIYAAARALDQRLDEDHRLAG
jgi:excisionase family DNA binding protein